MIKKVIMTAFLVLNVNAEEFKNIEIKKQTKFYYLTDKPETIINFKKNQPIEEVGYSNQGILEYKKLFTNGIVSEVREYTPSGNVDAISIYKNGRIAEEEVYFEGTNQVETKTWINAGFLEKIVSYRNDGSLLYSIEKNKKGELRRTLYGMNGKKLDEFGMPTPFPAILLNTRKTNAGDFAEYYDNGVIQSLIRVEYLDPTLRESGQAFLDDSPIFIESPELNIQDDSKGSIFMDGEDQGDGTTSFSMPQNDYSKKLSNLDYGEQKIVVGSFGIDSAYIKATPKTGILAVIFNIENNTEGDLRLDTAQFIDEAIPIKIGLKMHKTIKSEGKVSMKEVDSILIPAKKNVEFSMDGFHLMMVLDEKSNIIPEDVRSIKLGFDNGEYIDVSPKFDGTVNMSGSHAMMHHDNQSKNVSSDNIEADGHIINASDDKNKDKDGKKKIMSDGKLIAEEHYDDAGILKARVEYNHGKKYKKIIFDEYGLIDAIFTKYEDGDWKE